MSYPSSYLCPHCMVGTTHHGTCSLCGKSPHSTMGRDPTALPLGHILHQRYLIGGVLGKGGFGITYTAWDTHTSRRVAIKELFPSGIVTRSTDLHTIHVEPDKTESYQGIYQSFLRETHLLIQLQSLKGIVHLYHAFEENETVYYVMEHLDGEDLNKILKRTGPLSWNQTIPVLRDILDALEALHQNGLIHRDISPDNIFATVAGEYRLIDLGSTRNYQTATHFTTYLKCNFAPFEQFLTNSNQGPWTDVYSLCATVYYILTGKVPVTATARYQADTLVPLEQLCPGLPSHVYQAIRYGMAVRQEERCQSIGDLRKYLFPGETSQKYAPSIRYKPILECLSGTMAGKRWEADYDEIVTFGRELDRSIRFPAQTPGVSRKHCSMCCRKDGRILVKNESSQGTYLILNGQVTPLPQEEWYYADGCIVAFGQNEQFRMRRPGQ